MTGIYSTKDGIRFSLLSDEHPAWYEIYTNNALYHIFMEDGVWCIDEYEEKDSYSTGCPDPPYDERPVFQVED